LGFERLQCLEDAAPEGVSQHRRNQLNFLLRFQRFLVFKVREDPRPSPQAFFLRALAQSAEGAIGL